MLFISTERRVPRIYADWLVTIFAVGGGTAGVISCVTAVQSASEAVAIGSLLSIYAIGVGGRVAEKEYPKIGIYLCQIFFLAKIPVLQTSAITYHLIALFSYAVTLFPQQLTLTFSWFFGSDWELSIFHNVASSSYGVNVVPIGILVLMRFFARAGGELKPALP